MARIRSVHPGLFTDEAFVLRTPLARLLFIGIWTEADDLGAFEWKPVQLKMRLLPVDNADTGALLDELASANMVLRYSVNGREYGLVRNFGRFQRPKKPKSLHPIPDEFRLYLGLARASSEPDESDDGSGGAPDLVQADRVPKKSELTDPETGEVLSKSRKTPQMEDGGWRKNPNSREISPVVARGNTPERASGHTAGGERDAA